MERIMGLMLDKLGLNGILVSDIADIYKINDHDARPMPSTLESLPKLEQAYTLGIISNLPHDSLVSELDNYNLLPLFDTITISCQVGYRKPHPRIYQEALRRARATPKRSIFVSHDEQEVEGAGRVGMRSLLAKSLEEALIKLEDPLE